MRCKVHCSQLSTQQCALESRMCAWYGERNDCDLQCVYRYPKPANRTACEEDKFDCRWDTKHSVCKAACSRKETAQDCNKEWDCEIYIVDSKCVARCSTYNVSLCTNEDPLRCQVLSPGFYGDPSLHPTQWCDKTCRAEFYGNSKDCTSDTNCMWHQNLGYCTRSCGRTVFERWYALTGLPGMPIPMPYSYTIAPLPIGNNTPYVNVTKEMHDLCMNTPQCEWFEGECHPLCRYQYTTTEPCEADNRCKWNSWSGTCEHECNRITDQTICLDDRTCQWYTEEMGFPRLTGTCQAQCQTRYFQRVACQNDIECAWDRDQEKCKANCSVYTAKGICTKFSACEWYNNSCHLTCEAMCANSECCAIYERCMWDIPDKECTTHCVYLDEHDCTGHSSVCWWNSVAQKCLMRCSVRYPTTGNKTDAASCEADPECMYNDAPGQLVCVKDCNLRQDAQECTPDGVCKWEVNNVCTRQCKYRRDVDTCVADTTCNWLSATNLDYQCQLRCAERYKASGPCNADTQCLWDDKNKYCDWTCSLHNFSTCEASSMCETAPDGSARCLTRCQYRFTTLETCNTDNECLWNTDQKQCQRNCLAVQTADRCVDEPMCLWTGSSCIFRCRYRYFKQTDCEASKQTLFPCEWDKNSGRCDNSCDSYNNYAPAAQEPACRGDGECDWINDDTSGAICKKKCNARTTSYECSLWARCVWDSSVTACKLECVWLTDSLTCQRDSRCAWSPTYNKCQQTCRLRFGTNKALCLADADCMWRYNSRICQPDCWQYFSDNECEAIPDCMWNTRDRSCRRRCTIIAKREECVKYSACIWDETATKNDADGFCKYQCLQEYSTQSACDNDADCMWDKTVQQCKRTCSHINQNELNTTDLVILQQECVQEPMCYWSKGLCKTKCLYGHATKIMCQSDDECVWDETKSKCNIQCGLITTDVTCVDNGICRWNSTNYKCVVRCEYAYKTKPTCNAADLCMWDDSAARCVHACQEHSSQTNCYQDTLCYWGDGLCLPNCQAQFDNLDDCKENYFDPKGNYHCMWDESTKTCKTDCTLLAKAVCAQSPYMCIFSQLTNPNCLMRCGKRYGNWNMTGCEKDLNCMFDASSRMCVEGCSSYTAEGNCNSVKMCEWDINYQKCIRVCSTRSISSDGARCEDDVRCEVWNGACEKMCEYRYTQSSVKQCNDDPDCLFIPSTAVCTKSCTRYVLKECVANKMCEWLPNGCFDRCEYRYNTETTCSEDLECMWDTRRSRCAKNCGLFPYFEDCNTAPLCQWLSGKCVPQCRFAYKTSTECLSDQYRGCTWDKKTSTCINSCSLPTVQTVDLCESISVCELVPATPTTGTMSRDGRWYTCVDNCIIKYTTEATCKGSNGACIWDSTQLICLKNCSLITTSSRCFGQDICEYDPATQVCQMQCPYVGDCNVSRSDCKWNSHGKCSSQCGAFLTKKDCASDDDCYWNLQGGKCWRKCGVVDEKTGCSSNPACNYVEGADQPCTMHCSTAYTTPQACNDDNKCMYDTKNRQCKPSCRFISNSSDTATKKADCIKEMLCEWTNGACSMRCPYRADTQETCNLFPECYWYVERSTCQRKCQSITDSLECSLNPYCQVDNRTGGCSQNCRYRFTNESTCKLDWMCEWDGKTSACMTNCAVYTTSCAKDANCELWRSETGVTLCRRSCFAKYGTKDSCNNDARCVWNDVLSSCTQKCTLITSESVCESDLSKDVCEWSSFYSTCNVRCQVKYKSAAECNADSKCIWDTSLSEPACIPACREQETKSDCAHAAPCWWYPQGGVCKTACFNWKASTACVGDPTCFWDSKSLSCSLACSLRWTADQNKSCDADPQCSFDDISKICRAECDRIGDESGCRAFSSKCVWTTEKVCVGRCKVSFPTYDTCMPEEHCEWNSAKRQCDTKCNNVAAWDKEVCLQNDRCMYDAMNGKCYYECDFENVTECRTDVVCKVANDKCVFDCQGLTEARCNQMSACFFNKVSSVCTISCLNKYSTKDECATDDNCMWDPYKERCANKCQHNTASTCESTYACVLNNGKCDFSCPFKYSSKVPCNNDTWCMWSSGSQCVKTCNVYATADVCVPNLDCDWIPKLQLCRRKCELTPTSMCLDNQQCQLNASDLCERQCIYRWATQATCNGDKTCEWNPRLGTCGPIPCKTSIASVCDSDYRCEWVNDTNSCERNVCTPTDVVSCNQISVCEWYAKDSKCMRQWCPSNLSEELCLRRYRCKFEGNRCLKRCDYEGTKPECVADLTCDWQYGSKCGVKCENQGLAYSDCIQNNNCMWDNSRTSCVTTCARRTDETTCGSFGSCKWTGKYCKVRCATQHPDMDSCRLDPLCSIFYISGSKGVEPICSEACSALTKDLCDSTGLCRFSQKVNTCIPRCTYRFQEMKLCNSESECIWNPASENNELCSEACEIVDILKDQASCNAVSACYWTTKQCVTKCSLRHVGESEGQCRADGNCTWGNETAGVPSCTRACSLYFGTPTDCPMERCFINTNGLCAESCGVRYSTQERCDADTECEWDVVEGNCDPTQCKNRTISHCETSDALCQVYGTKCELACNKRSMKVLCTASAACYWKTTDPGSCAKKCSLFPQAKCNADNNEQCAYISGLAQCVMDCKFITQDVSCTEQKAYCEWSAAAQKCTRICKYRYEGTDALSQCVADPECTLTANGKACTPKRCQYTESAACNADQQCMWSDVDKACLLKDCSYTTADSCALNIDCEWLTTMSGSRCQTKSCPPRATYTVCLSNNKCAYIYDNATCQLRQCWYDVREQCSAVHDKVLLVGHGNHTNSLCKYVGLDCVYSDWTAWSACSLTVLVGAGGRRMLAHKLASVRFFERLPKEGKRARRSCRRHVDATWTFHARTARKSTQLTARGISFAAKSECHVASLSTASANRGALTCASPLT